MFIVSLRSVYGPGPSQGVHRADGPSYGPGSKWGSMDTGSMFCQSSPMRCLPIQGRPLN